MKIKWPLFFQNYKIHYKKYNHLKNRSIHDLQAQTFITNHVFYYISIHIFFQHYVGIGIWGRDIKISAIKTWNENQKKYVCSLYLLDIKVKLQTHHYWLFNSYEGVEHYEMNLKAKGSALGSC